MINIVQTDSEIAKNDTIDIYNIIILSNDKVLIDEPDV